MNTQGLQKVTQTIGGAISKNSPTILTGLSVAGLIGTTIMAVKATPKALKIIEQLEDDWTYKAEPVTKTKIVKATWKCYLPTALMGAATIGCIIGSNSINLRRNAALAGLYSLSETALKEYQSKVVEKIGKDKAKEIKDEIAKDKINKDPLKSHEFVIAGRGDTLCYDSLSGRYFWSTMEDIKAAINNMNKRMMNDMFVPLNDLYSDLELDGTDLGDLVGWYIDDGLVETDFSAIVGDDGRPCLVIEYDIKPRYCKRDF
jgi:hypothetical protein